MNGTFSDWHVWALAFAVGVLVILAVFPWGASDPTAYIVGAIRKSEFEIQKLAHGEAS